MNFDAMKYPVEENTTESWSRFNRIYELTVDLAGGDYSLFIRDAEIEKSWKAIVNSWKDNSRKLNKINFFYEALFHICFGRFSSKVTEDSALKLVLLIEDELTRYGYAFNVWESMQDFIEAYKNIMNPAPNSEANKCVRTLKLKQYLRCRLFKKVILKDKYPDEWDNKLDCARNAYRYGTSYLRSNMEQFEESITFLIPEAIAWSEQQWCDEVQILEKLKQLYGVDYSTDLRSFDYLLDAVRYRDMTNQYTYYLYYISTFSLSLAQRFWGERYESMVLFCFMDIYKRYRRSGKTQR